MTVVGKHIKLWPYEYARIGDISETRLFGIVIKSEIHADKWKPIETAPKDGTEILAMQDIPYPVYMVVSWEDFDVDENMKWHSVDGIYHKDLFTHWMPLPAPPTEA